MYYVYLLRDTGTGLIYTGYSADLRRRIQQHRNCQVKTTKKFKSIELVYYEAFLRKEDARRRETYLKTTKGKRAIKLMLKYSLDGPVV